MEIFIIIVLLVIAAETTYLMVSSNRKNGRLMQSPAFVDTSVLIDGRIVAIAESGFISRPLYIPRSVVGELQYLADNADSEKRARARHGLDVISILQENKLVKVTVYNDGTRASDGVDNRLLELAKKNGGAICTIDYNLNKVAVVEGIEVLNVNELAKSLRMAYLPGERTFIELTQKGNDSHQAVGHLSDGTMVVVEHAYKQIGTKAEVEFIRGIQTAAGKMMFAKLIGAPEKSKTTTKASAVVEKRVKTVGRKAPASATIRKPRTEVATVDAQGAQQVVQAQPEVVRASKATQAPSKAPQPRQTQQRTPRAPRAQQSQQVAPVASSQTQATAKPQSPRQNQNRRRRSPEDSMVELANRSE